MYGVNEVSIGTPGAWLDTEKQIPIPDIGAIEERTQWFTSGYDKLKKNNQRAKQGLYRGTTINGITIRAGIKTSLIPAKQLQEYISILPAHTTRPAAFDNTPFQTTISNVKKYGVVRKLKKKSLSISFCSLLYQHLRNTNPLLKGHHRLFQSNKPG